MDKDVRPVWPWFVLIIIISALLRIYNLGTESLWMDEGNSLRDAQVVTIARQSKPLYYWILSAWLHITRSEAGMRFLAVIFGVAGVGLLYFVGRQLISRRVGLIAALLMAVSPFHINHSQEVRMYTLITLCGLISVYSLILMMQAWSFKRVAAYVITTYLMLLTHPLTIFLLVPQGCYMLMHWRQKRIKVARGIIALLVVGILWAPWIPHVMKFSEHFIETQKWAVEAERLSPTHIPLLWGQFMYGEWNRLSYADKLALRYAHYGYALGITLLALTTWFIGRRKREMWIIGLWVMLPLVSMITLSILLDRGWSPRYLIYTSPALFLLAAWPVSKLPKKTAYLLMIMILLLPMFRLQRYYSNIQRPQWRDAVRYLESAAGPDDIIYVYKPSNRFLFSYYYQGKARWKALGQPASDGGINNFLESDAPQRIADAVQASLRFWLIMSAVGEELPEEVQQELVSRRTRFNHHSFYGIDIVEVLQPER